MMKWCRTFRRIRKINLYQGRKWLYPSLSVSPSSSGAYPAVPAAPQWPASHFHSALSVSARHILQIHTCSWDSASRVITGLPTDVKEKLMAMKEYRMLNFNSSEHACMHACRNLLKVVWNFWTQVHLLVWHGGYIAKFKQFERQLVC